MDHYRLYVLDRDGAVVRCHDIAALNDDGALTKAKSLANGLAFEVWQSVRRVGCRGSHGEKAASRMTLTDKLNADSKSG